MAYIQTFEFLNVNIEKRISQRVRGYYSKKLRLLHELRDTSLSKEKKKKIVYIAVCITVCSKYLF